MTQETKAYKLKNILGRGNRWRSVFAIAIIASLYFASLSYLNSKRAQMDDELTSVQQEVNWLSENKTELSRRLPENFKSFTLLNDVHIVKSAVKHGIKINVSANNIYSFSNVPYKNLIAWLFDLEIETGVEIVRLDFSVQDNGGISGNLGVKNGG